MRHDKIIRPCDGCVVRGICSNKPMVIAMRQCPPYKEYVEKMSKTDGKFQEILDWYTKLTEVKDAIPMQNVHNSGNM